METYLKPPKTGIEAFELMPEGTLCQLINNTLVMSPAPTPAHQSVSAAIYQELAAFVKINNMGKLFYSPIDVYLNDKNIMQPDIVFVLKEREKIIDWNKGIFGAPDFIIEILSKGNYSYDLNEKKKAYENAGVKEYWVVDPNTKWCEGFVLKNSFYQSLGEETGKLSTKMFNISITI